MRSHHEAQLLLDACRMWCVTTGQKPSHEPVEQEWIFRRAVQDFDGGFKDLNALQRRVIAGIRRDFEVENL